MMFSLIPKYVFCRAFGLLCLAASALFWQQAAAAPAVVVQGKYQEVSIATPTDLKDPVDLARDPVRQEFSILEKHGNLRVFKWLPGTVPVLHCDVRISLLARQELSALSYSTDGKSLYVADQRSGNILVFQRPDSNQCWQQLGDAIESQAVLPGVAALYPGWYGQQLIASSKTRPRIKVFDRNTAGGLSEGYEISIPKANELGAIAGRHNGSELLVADVLENKLLFLTRSNARWQLSGKTIDLSDTPRGSFQGPVSMTFFADQLYVVAGYSEALLVYREEGEEWVLKDVVQGVLTSANFDSIELKTPKKVWINPQQRQLVLVSETGLLLFAITENKPLVLIDIFRDIQGKLVSALPLFQPYRLVTVNQFDQIRTAQWQKTEPEDTEESSVKLIEASSLLLFITATTMLLF